MSNRPESTFPWAAPSGVFCLPCRPQRWDCFSFRRTARGGVLPFLAVPAAFFAVFLWYVLVSGVRVAAQWERGVVLFLGKFRSVKGPGLSISFEK